MSAQPHDPQGVATVPPSAATEDGKTPVPEPGHSEHVAASRRSILEAVGESGDVTFVHGVGNTGDQLIAAGARTLLAGVFTREIGLADVPRARGAVAVLCGSGAWCGPYHELMPPLLPVLERRFGRVVVLPSSFDATVPEVRRALEGSRATVFARERDSLDLIKGLCDARLAHDTAFFFDFAPYRRPGRGTLEAFRSDREATGRPIPPGNVDVSVVSATLDEWLHTLARHALIRTDRAHVLIAGALLGKRVEWAASSTRKLPAIAAFALEGRFPVRRLDAPASPGCAAGAPRAPGDKTPVPGAVRARLAAAGREAIAAPRAAPDCVAAPRVTVVVLSWNRAAHVHEALRSLRENAELPWRALVVDNASSPATREVLRREAAADPRIALELLDRNLGCAGGRNHAASAADTEFVMFLDDDAEVLPGTLERLVETLDGDPDALAAAAHIVLPDGRTQICGGGFSVADGVVRFEPLGAGRPFEEVAAEPAGPCRWVGGAGVLYRREALSRFPIDTGMAAYFEDNEWGFRVESEVPGSLRRCPSALVLHHQVAKGRLGSSAADVAHAIRFCEPIAHFYARHGLVMEELFGWVGELSGPAGRDVAAARLFCELLQSRGAQWTVAAWLDGGLDPLFGRVPAPPPPAEPIVLDESRAELHRVWGSKWYGLALRYWIARHAVRAALGIGDRR